MKDTLHKLIIEALADRQIDKAEALREELREILITERMILYCKAPDCCFLLARKVTFSSN